MTNEQLQTQNKMLINTLKAIKDTIAYIDDRHYTDSDAIFDIRSIANVALANVKE